MNGAEAGMPNERLFGRWRFDSSTGDLSDGESAVRLEPQVAKLLRYFLGHQGVLTSRDELMAAVWDGRIVSDDAINRCVSILRQTLSPEDKNRYIETVVRRGFISHFPEPAAATAAELSPARKTMGIAALAIVVAGLVLLIAVLTYGYWSDDLPSVARGSPALQPMVAVLPFQSTGFAGDGEFFANGVHDNLLTQLAQLESLRVISRTSVMEYRDTKLSIAEIAEELGADAILEGSVQRAGDLFRINIQLIDAHSDVHLWAQRYDRELLPATIFQTQTEIAIAIAAALNSTLSSQDSTQLSVLPTENMAAYRAYREAMNIRDTLGNTAPGYVAALEQAVALDPNFVRAWAELVGWLCYDSFRDHEPESIRRVEQILQHIRALAPESAELLIAQSFYSYYLIEDYEQAYALIMQAQSLRPSDERVVELKSFIQRRLGDFAGRVESVRLIRGLDPRNPLWTIILASSLVVVHRYDEAIVVLEDSPAKNLRQSSLAARLALQEHRDFARWRAELDALELEYGSAVGLAERWNSRIAARDYRAAQALLDEDRSRSDPRYATLSTSRMDRALMPLISAWFLKSEDRLQTLATQRGAEFKVLRGTPRRNEMASPDLALAFVSAVQGDGRETKRLVRHWRRTDGKDLAVLAGTRLYACRALGITNATAEATDCIRSALVEPSFLMPFIEPYLPYYDGMRNEPEFVALVAEITAGTRADP